MVGIYYYGGENMVDAALEKKLVIDSRRNVWVFYSDTSGKVCCSVKRSRGETAAEQLNLNETVEEYDIMMDERDNIHLVALTSGQRIVYVRRGAQEWERYVLYSFAGEPVSLSNLKTVSAAGGSLHLFYVYAGSRGGSALFHHQWTGDQWKGYRVFDIPAAAGRVCYDADTNGGERLRIAATVGQVLSLWEFDGANWIQSVRNKSGVWEKTENLLMQKSHILAKTGRGVLFVKEADDLDKLQPEEIIESRHVDEGPVLVDRRNALYIAWGKEGSLGYRASYDEGASWGRVKYYHHVREDKLEVYGFSNNYSLLVNAKKLIATSPPEIHIPFLHRSVERIRFQQDLFYETPGEGPIPDGKCKGNIDDEYINSMDKPPRGGDGAGGKRPAGDSERILDRYLRDDGKVPCETGETDCPYSQAQAKAGLSEETRAEIERVWAEIERIKQVMETDIRERLDRLEAEIVQLKDGQKNAGKGGAPLPGRGSVITQDMINRYLRKK
jgi:hypothetical protein